MRWPCRGGRAVDVHVLPSLGVVAYLLRQSGFDWNHLLNSDHAMTLIVIAACGSRSPYNFLFFLAGLQSIPKSLIEAAAIDGAGPWRRFWSIQFPLLSPTTFFLLVINVVYAFFDTFAIVDSTTQGGRGKTPRSWSTRSITMASRPWTWADRPRNRWC